MDGKHIANYKDFFSLVLLALVDAEYICIWIDCGSSGLCSDAQIFNRSLLREKQEDGTFGFPAPEPMEEGATDLHHFWLSYDDCMIVRTCVVLHNMLRTHHSEADRAPNPANGAATLQNEQVVYVPNENYRNPSMENENC